MVQFSFKISLISLALCLLASANIFYDISIYPDFGIDKVYMNKGFKEFWSNTFPSNVLQVSSILISVLIAILLFMSNPGDESTSKSYFIFKRREYSRRASIFVFILFWLWVNTFLSIFIGTFSVEKYTILYVLYLSIVIWSIIQVIWIPFSFLHLLKDMYKQKIDSLDNKGP